MDGRVFGSIFALALFAAGLAGWQHFRSLTEKKDDAREMRTLLANAQARLVRKQADVEASQSKLDMAQAIIQLDQDKQNLNAEISQLETARAAAQQKLTETINQVRVAAFGTAWPDLTLPNGQALTGVKIQKATDADLSLSHSGGVVKVSAKDLPEELKERLGYGVSPPSGPASLPR